MLTNVHCGIVCHNFMLLVTYCKLRPETYCILTLYFNFTLRLYIYITPVIHGCTSGFGAWPPLFLNLYNITVKYHPSALSFLLLLSTQRSSACLVNISAWMKAHHLKLNLVNVSYSKFINVNVWTCILSNG